MDENISSTVSLQETIKEAIAELLLFFYHSVYILLQTVVKLLKVLQAPDIQTAVVELQYDMTVMITFDQTFMILTLKTLSLQFWW